MGEFLYDGPKIEFTPRCLVLKSDPSLENYLKDHSNGFQSVDVDDLGITIVYSILPDPHPGSEAEYFEETPDGQFCGVIRKRRFTSAHFHKDAEEYRIIGKAGVYQEGYGWTIVNGTHDKPGELLIPPGVAHFAVGLNGSAITMIKLTNASNYPKDEWHIPVVDQHVFKNSAILEFLVNPPEDRQI